MTHISTIPSPEAVERAMAADQSFAYVGTPVVRAGFHGELTFQYRNGHLVLVRISETLIPDAASNDSRPSP
jgi:hypothetical protein